MRLLLRSVRLIDPSQEVEETCDLLLEDGKVARRGLHLSAEGAEVIDGTGLVAAPGLVDMHVHFRDPGQEQKEDIASGSRAAAHGGFTAVCTMPNTSPVVDDAVAVEYVKARAAAVGKCRVVVAGACSKDLKGEELTRAMKEKIEAKDGSLKGSMASQGTTPRRLTDLIGSLCDLTSGSGDKGTPIVFIQGYFDTFAEQ